MILIVAYDLHAPGRDYEDIEALLETADGGSVHFQQSVWLLDTSETPSVWRDRLREAGDSNDEYFVAQLVRNWSSYNMDRSAVAWLKDPSRSW